MLREDVPALQDVTDGGGTSAAPVISISLEIQIDSLLHGEHAAGMILDQAASRLEALGNPTRLRIYRSLVRAGSQGSPVGRLKASLGIPSSTLSHHLKTLLAVELVTQERQATTLVCRANYEVMHELVGFLVEECCADASCGSAAGNDAAA